MAYKVYIIKNNFLSIMPCLVYAGFEDVLLVLSVPTWLGIYFLRATRSCGNKILLPSNLTSELLISAKSCKVGLSSFATESPLSPCLGARTS
jgi:hypothetical protein